MGGQKFDPLSLERYMDSEPLKIQDTNPEYPIQKELFEYNEEGINFGYRMRIGAFYEILSKAIFGGRWLGNRNASQNGTEIFQPDVVNSEIIMESKSVSWGESLKLTDFQTDRYLLQQCENFYLNPRQIFFSIYKYKLRHPLTCFKEIKGNKLEGIVSLLSRETGYMLFLPFSVISTIHNPETQSKFKSRYEGDKYDPLTRFSAKGIKRMLLSPGEVLESFSLSLNDYEITRTRFPGGIKMNKYSVQPFPVLLIKDKNYESWFEEFRKENEEKSRRVREEENFL